MYRLIHNLFPTSVGINTFITIMLLAITTTCDGGALLTTQGIHICLILSFIWLGGRVASISTNMRHMHGPMVHKEGGACASECKIA